MGGTQSVDSATKNIKNLEDDVDTLVIKIQKDGNDAVTAIVNSKLNSDELCRRLRYQYTEVLKNNFPVRTLNGAKIQLGIDVPDLSTAKFASSVTSNLAKNLVIEKENICKAIIDLYVTKVDIINKLHSAVPDCRDKERMVFNNLSDQMRGVEKLTDERWSVAYKNMTTFNKEIKTKYTNIKSMIYDIYSAETKAQLDRLVKDAIGLINDTNAVCERYIDVTLRDFKSSGRPSLPELPSSESEPEII